MSNYKGFTITKKTTRTLIWSSEKNKAVPAGVSTRFCISIGRGGTIELSTLDAAKATIDQNGKGWKAAAKAEARMRFRQPIDLICR